MPSSVSDLLPLDSLMDTKPLTFALVAFLCAGAASASELVVNGDFETGGLTGWTFTPDVGSEPTMTPEVVSFQGSNAFRVNPGNNIGQLNPRLGGTLSQSVMLAGGGAYDVSAQLIAIQDTGGTENSDGGTIAISLDGVLLHAFDVGGILGSTTRFDIFSTRIISQSDGPAPLEIRFTRGFKNFGPAIYHYLDGVSVTPVPEPSTTASVLIGLSLLPAAPSARRRAAAASVSVTSSELF